MTDYILAVLFYGSCLLWVLLTLVAAGALSVGLVYLGWLLLY